MQQYVIATDNSQSSAGAACMDRMRASIRRKHPDWLFTGSGPGHFIAVATETHGIDKAVSLTRESGFIIGTLFRSEGHVRGRSRNRVTCLSEEDSLSIIKTRGRHLVSQYWGNYIAVLHQSAGELAVLRGPMSSLACLYGVIENITVFFSDITDFQFFSPRPLPINWDSISAQVVDDGYLNGETGFANVRAVDGGECVVCRQSTFSSEYYWDPRKYLEDRSVESFSALTQVIADSTDYGISAAASLHDHILVNLSGGLDSSIILSALSRTEKRPRLTAVNYNSRACGDERRYARDMAKTAGCQLIEHDRNDQLDLRRFTQIRLTAQPVLNFSAPDVEERNNELAVALGASSIFNGELGDNVFGASPNPGALVECFRRHGLRWPFFRSIWDYSMLTQHSLCSTLRSTFEEHREGLSNFDFRPWSRPHGRHATNSLRSSFLASDEVFEHSHRFGARFHHRWFTKSRHLAPGAGTLLYALVVITSTSYHSPFMGPKGIPQISPLASQPLVEVALRIPAFLNFQDAQDRAIARAAYTSLLPRSVIDRGKGKGGPSVWAKDVVEANLAFLREYFLDGILVKRKLIDRTKVEATFAEGLGASAAVASDIFAKLYIEAWLRACRSA